MTTKRVPIGRQAATKITDRAIELFDRMCAIKCACEPIDWEGEYWKHRPCGGCDRWWDLHSELHDEMKCKVWDWPCIQSPKARSPYPAGSFADEHWKPDLEAQALWRALAKASATAQRAKRQAVKAARQKPVAGVPLP
jgi:hypothetical protein